VAFLHSRMLRLHGILESPVFRHLFSVVAISRSHPRNAHNFVAKVFPNAFRSTRSKRENEKLDEMRSVRRSSVDRFPRRVFRGRGHFRAVSSPRIRRRELPRRIFAGSEYGNSRPPLCVRRCRGSPVCKKELSSNRINDPLASIYRTRERWRGRGARRRDTQGRTRRTVFEGSGEAAAVSPCRPFAASPSPPSPPSTLRARKILFAFLRCRKVYAVAGSLTARVLFLRTRL